MDINYSHNYNDEKRQNIIFLFTQSRRANLRRDSLLQLASGLLVGPTCSLCLSQGLSQPDPGSGPPRPQGARRPSWCRGLAQDPCPPPSGGPSAGLGVLALPDDRSFQEDEHRVLNPAPGLSKHRVRCKCSGHRPIKPTLYTTCIFIHHM